MVDIGLRGFAYAGAGSLDAGQRAGAQADGGESAFNALFRHAVARGNVGAPPASPSGAASSGDASPSGHAGSPAGARRGMADPADWAATHGAPAGNPAERSSAAEQLADYLSMPLGKRMFYMVLASMGISKEQYDAMSPEDQAKVAAQVAQRLKDNAESQKQAADRKDGMTVSA